MDSQHLMYKPIRSTGPYDRYIAKQKQKQISQRKELFYHQIFKFAQSRYPKEFLLELQRQINPFQHSLQSMRELILRKYPDLTEDVVNESVQYVFGKKSRQAVMIKQSQTIIEDGDQYIRNGRKLIKQDFSYFFDKPLNETLPLDANQGNQTSPRSRLNRSQRGSITKRSNTSRQDPYQRKRRTSQYSIIQSQKQPLSSPRKNNVLSVSKNQLFNDLIAQQIQKQNNRFKNMDIIYEDDPQDILQIQQFKKKPGFTDRSLRSGRNNQSFPNFKQRDIIVPIEGGMETGRSDMQQLNHLLQEVTVICEQKQGQTERSDRGLYMMKISKKNMDNLYNMKGSLKLDTIKRAANRMISQYS